MSLRRMKNTSAPEPAAENQNRAKRCRRIPCTFPRVPAGGASDFSARLFAERLSQRWGQAVIVENRPGADGVIGVAAFLNTDDDHTLLYAISAVYTVLPITHAKLPYDPQRELVPISPTSDVVLAMAVPEKKSSRSLHDLVQAARAQPGK